VLGWTPLFSLLSGRLREVFFELLPCSLLFLYVAGLTGRRRHKRHLLSGSPIRDISRNTISSEVIGSILNLLIAILGKRGLRRDRGFIFRVMPITASTSRECGGYASRNYEELIHMISFADV
jgi:hypothetical protein